MTTLELGRNLTRTRAIEISFDPRIMEELVDEASELSLPTLGEQPARHRTLTEECVALFKDGEETVGLTLFLDALDSINMGHSVDLNIWLRRWRAA